MPFDMTGLVLALSRRDKDAAKRRLSKDRAEHIVGNLCAITRVAVAEGRVLTPLGCEGLYRRVIRSELVLQGWPWADADRTALDLVAVVFAILQVKRPSWAEGQPEWTIEAGSLIERTRCVHCHKDLPEGHHKFCGKLCRTAHGLRMMRMREANENQMAVMASRYDL